VFVLKKRHLFGFIISIFLKEKKKIIESFLLIVLCPDFDRWMNKEVVVTSIVVVAM